MQENDLYSDGIDKWIKAYYRPRARMRWVHYHSTLLQIFTIPRKHTIYDVPLGMCSIRKCLMIIYRLKNTVSWRHQLQTTSAKIQPCESSAVLSPILFPITVC